MLAFTSVYFSESGLFNGLQAKKIKFSSQILSELCQPSSNTAIPSVQTQRNKYGTDCDFCQEISKRQGSPKKLSRQGSFWRVMAALVAVIHASRRPERPAYFSEDSPPT